MRRALCAVVAAALALVAACDPERREAASVVAAVDRYRKAEMGAKGPLADALAAVECSEPAVCAARDACLAAARPTVKGAALKKEVESSLADLRAGKITQDEASSRALPQKLADAERLLDEGRVKIASCDQQATALRLKYGL